MIIFAAFVFMAVFAAGIRGGRVREVGSLSLRGEALILGLFVAQAIARGRVVVPLPVRLHWNSATAWVLFTVALLVVLLLNFRTLGVPIAFVGIATNLVVVLANGSMPVAPSAIAASRVSAGVPALSAFYSLVSSRLLVLGDVVPALSVGQISSGLVVSVGDILLLIGVLIVVVHASIPRLPEITDGCAMGTNSQ